MVKPIPILFVFILLSSFGTVYAESVNNVKSQMDDYEKSICVTKVITDGWHVPVRIEFEFDELDSTDPNAVQWSSTGTDIQFNKNDKSAIIETDEINYHQGKMILTYPYDLEPNSGDNHEFFYRIWSESDQVEEGTYITKENTFCIVFWFFSQEPPIKYDEEYFEEQYSIIHGKKQDEILENQEKGTAYYWIGAVFGIISSVVVVVVMIVIIVKFRDVKSTLLSPINRLKKAIEHVGRIREILEQDATNFEITANKVCDKLLDESRILSKSAMDLVEISAGLKKEPEIKQEATFADLLSDDTDVSDIDDTNSNEKKQNIFSKITTIPHTLKEKFSSYDADKELEDMTPDEMKKHMSRWTYDELQELMMYLTKKINNGEETEHDRTKYRIAREIARGK